MKRQHVIIIVAAWFCRNGDGTIDPDELAVLLGKTPVLIQIQFHSTIFMITYTSWL